jgi:hypothetical protein
VARIGHGGGLGETLADSSEYPRRGPYSPVGERCVLVGVWWLGLHHRALTLTTGTQVALWSRTPQDPRRRSSRLARAGSCRTGSRRMLPTRGQDLDGPQAAVPCVLAITDRRKLLSRGDMLPVDRVDHDRRNEMVPAGDAGAAGRRRTTLAGCQLLCATTCWLGGPSQMLRRPWHQCWVPSLPMSARFSAAGSEQRDLSKQIRVHSPDTS